MKQIVLVLIVGLAFISTKGIASDSKTRTETEVVYKVYNNGKVSKWRKSCHKSTYEKRDRKGRIIEIGEYGEIRDKAKVKKNKDGSTIVTLGHVINYKKLNTVLYYQYDSVGRKFEDELWQFCDGNRDELINRIIYEYDSIGKLNTETEFYRNDSIPNIKQYSYKKDETVISEGKSQKKILYNEVGRPIEKAYYKWGEFKYKIEYQYNRRDNITTEIRYNDDSNTIHSITERKYNYNNKITREHRKVIGTKVEKKDIYLYNTNERLVKVLHYSGDELESYTKYKYT